MTTAASTEFPATARFSRRMDSAVKVARISGIDAIIALDAFAANPLVAPFPASGRTCYDYKRRNFSLEDIASCVPSISYVSCVYCSRAWPLDKLRLPRLPPRR
jgi:hypothetical protein